MKAELEHNDTPYGMMILTGIDTNTVCIHSECPYRFSSVLLGLIREHTNVRCCSVGARQWVLWDGGTPTGAVGGGMPTGTVGQGHVYGCRGVGHTNQCHGVGARQGVPCGGGTPMGAVGWGRANRCRGVGHAYRCREVGHANRCRGVGARQQVLSRVHKTKISKQKLVWVGYMAAGVVKSSPAQ
jgi:hypothetical protein